MEEEHDKKTENGAGCSLVSILWLIVSIAVIWWLWGVISGAGKSWTLFVYSSENPDINSLLNRADNLTKDSCIRTGLAYTKDFGSYECGYDCKFSNKYLTETCDKTCDHGGCRD